MKKIFIALAYTCTIFGKNSITANYTAYRETCGLAVSDPEVFHTFRSIAGYRTALEIDDGNTFAEYIRNRSYLSQYLDTFRQLDSLGQPILDTHTELGEFSATTLRYIFHADQIKKHFSLPENPTVVEIGAGFGGQSYILQILHPCKKYYIYDLPEVEGLIQKVMEHFAITTVSCLPIEQDLPEERIDLVISNYAYSECDRDMQMEYFNKIIKKSDRGYMVYNTIAAEYNLDSLSKQEFIALLKENGYKVKTFAELFAGAGNYLILWSRI